MKLRLVLFPFSLFLLLAQLAAAQQSAIPNFQGIGTAGSPTLVAVHLEIGAPRNGTVTGTAVADIEPGWHIASAHPLDQFTIPTLLTLVSGPLQLEHAEYPAHVVRNFDFAGGKVAVYEGTIRIPFIAKYTGGGAPVVAKLRYQACNDSICLPPADVTATSALPAGDGAAAVAGAPPAAPSSSPASRGGPWSSDLSGTFAAHGLGLTLLVVFVAGLALNLTPCVYPLIPITLAYFASQSGERRGQRAALSTLYVLGIAITYSTLGVFAALSGRLFGSWLQLPAVLMAFALMMLALALSMFGVYEIRIPHVIADRAGARAGYAGAVTMGLLVGVVAAPCVGPFVISLIALVGQLGRASIGFILFFVLALGLGLPYLVLGIFSSGLASMPRSGAWMDQVKKAMGFVLIAMAFYFLRPLTGEEVYVWGVTVSLAVGAFFLLFARRAPQRSGNVVRWSLAALLLVAGALFAMPRNRVSDIVWSPYDEQILAASQTSAKPVLIDFYADWCLPCKELDAKTFSNAGVASEAARFVRLKADLTEGDVPKVKELSARYHIIGVPTVVLLDRSGREVSRLTGFEPPSRFLERLRQVR